VNAQEEKMTTSTKTVERVKEGVGELVDRTREVVNDSLDTAREKLEGRMDDFDRQYRKVRGGAVRVADTVRDQFDGVRTNVRDRYKVARKKVVRADRDLRDYVKDNPRKSLLITSGVGLFVGFLLTFRRNRS
jgi:ElaB/YqjD/DUF883 family membrane-anchored ribosome-binding protein